MDNGQLSFLMRAQCSVTPGILVILILLSSFFVVTITWTLVKMHIFLSYISKSSSIKLKRWLLSCEIVWNADGSSIKLHPFFKASSSRVQSEAKRKGKKKHPQNLQGRLEPAFCLTNGASVFFVFIRCSNKLEISSVIYCTYVKGEMLRYLWPKSSKQSS